ncbi:hypothetical protein H0H93_003262 [Arthromyces matolae]|nr:hypothetical protein H0H93_003262 [Arthromyces matolae]
MYTKSDDAGWEQSNAFKIAFSTPVSIEFLGVWDTVDSVGIIPKRLPFTTSNTIVRTFRHAIALDERRAKFKANLWNRPNDTEQTLGVHTVRIPTPTPSVNEKSKSSAKNGKHFTRKPEESKDDKKLTHYETIYSAKETQVPTDVLEVWFAGCHCDVGGGSVDNKTPHSLARISLRWMVRECFKTNSGIMFNTEGLRTIGLDPATLYPFVLPRPPPRLDASTALLEKRKEHGFFKRMAITFKRKPKAQPSAIVTTNDQSAIDEEMEDLKDAMSPLYDQLDIKLGWWLLEILPLNLRYQNGRNEWVNTFKSNMAHPRFIPKQHSNGVRVHRTVKLRMDAQPSHGHKSKYKPKAHLAVEPTWID